MSAVERHRGPRPETVARNEELARLRAQGMTCREIGEATGLRRRQVEYILSVTALPSGEPKPKRPKPALAIVPPVARPEAARQPVQVTLRWASAWRVLRPDLRRSSVQEALRAGYDADSIAQAAGVPVAEILAVAP